MHPFIQDKLPQIAALCRRHRVRRLDLFGSATGARFDPASSDVDLVVEFLPGAPKGLAGSYFGLKEQLETLFGREVNLVSRKAIRNRYFREEIEETQEGLYEAPGAQAAG